PDDVAGTATLIKHYIAAVYPVDDYQLSVGVDCISPVRTPAGRLPWSSWIGYDIQKLLGQLSRLARDDGFDEAIGIVRPGWFRDVAGQPETGGESMFGIHASLVEIRPRGAGGVDLTSVAAAHELAHTCGCVSDGNPLATTDDPHHFIVPADGYIPAWG